MSPIKYVFIFLFSGIASFLIIKSLKKRKYMPIPFIYWSITSLALLIGKGDKVALGIILSSFLILFMDSSEAFWNKKIDKKFLKNTILWIGIIAILYFANIRINFLTKPDGTYLYFNNLTSIILTTLWLLIIVNSIKLSSLIPGFTSAFIFTISLIFFVIAAAQKQNLNTAVVLSLTLSSISFPLINYEFRYPKMNITKELNLFYGFLLGIISITGMLKSPATISIIIPAVLLSIPIIDTSYAIVSSLVLGKPKNLILETIIKRFSDKKISNKKMPLLIYATGLYLAISSLVLYFYPNIWLGIILLGNGILFYNKTFLKEEVINKETENTKTNEKFHVGDIPIDRVTLDEAVKKIETFIISGAPHMVITPDSLAILRARKDREYKSLIHKADLVTPDGSGLLFASKILGNPIRERVTGIDLIDKLFQIGEKRGYRFYFLGAKKGVTEKAMDNLLKKYPNIKIVGIHHGYFKDEKVVLKDIKEKQPDILLVGMGVPKQEKWISEHMEKLRVPVSIGVGGSFDVLSGKIPRAPKWMQKYGIEWVYRTIKEPNRIKRIIKIPYFILWIFFLTLKEKFIKNDKGK